LGRDKVFVTLLPSRGIWIIVGISIFIIIAAIFVLIFIKLNKENKGVKK